MLRSWQENIARRRLLLGGAISGLGALVAGTPAAAQQPPPPPPGIQILDYDPPRRFSRGARVGNIVYLAGEDGKVWTSGNEWYMVPGGIGPQTERAFENIRESLQAFGTDLDHIFKMTSYFISYNDRAVFSEVRRRYLSRPVPGTAIQVSSLSDLESVVEIDVMALVP